MDPYKVLGVSESKIKHDSDLIPVRRRAKQLFKRHSAEKKKFDAKKVLEAFEMIKRNLKGRVGEGQYKMLGRSRKERELDKHFNHQTKEIKNDKNLKRTLKQARHGEKRVRLRGDKERVARPRRRAHKRYHRKKQLLKSKKHVDSLQGLQKLSRFLESQAKFPKAIPLLNRWVREYMNHDNRGHVFKVLHQLSQAEYVTEDADSRQQVIQVYEYVIGYFSAWFEEDSSQQMLRWAWRVACVLSCHCFTDDAFILSRTIATLSEVLALIETNKELLNEETQFEPSPNSPFGLPTPPGSPQSPHQVPVGMPTPLGSPSLGMPTPLPTPLPLQTPLGSPSVSDEGEGMMEFYATPSSSDEEGEEAAPRNGHKDEIKDEKEDKFKDDIKDEFEDKVEIKEENIDVKAMKLKREAKVDPKKNPRKRRAVEIDSGSDVKEEVIDDDEDEVIDSEDSIEMEVAVDSDEDSGSVFESLSSGSSSAVEYVDATFLVPPSAVSLRRICAHFVYRCLGTLFAHRGALWARSKVDTFFQDVFYRRSVFLPDQITQIEAWQSRIKVLQKNGERAVGETNNPLEANRPVVDSREMRTVIDSDSNAWAAKQTFDSRDKCGGSKIIR